MSFVTKGVETCGRVVVVDDRCDGVAPLSLQPHANSRRCLEVADVSRVAPLLRDDPQGGAFARVTDDRPPGLPALAPGRLDEQVTPRQPEPCPSLRRWVQQVALDQPCASAG